MVPLNVTPPLSSVGNDALLRAQTVTFRARERLRNSPELRIAIFEMLSEKS